MAATVAQLPGKPKDLQKKRKFRHSNTGKSKGRVVTSFDIGAGSKRNNNSKNGEEIRALRGRRENESGSDLSDSEEEEDEKALPGEVNEEDEYGPDDLRLQRITKFAEGCRAFKTAFTKIMKKNVSSDALGPILSAHKKLVVEKLAEEVTEQKTKGGAKKEKHLLGEKGHVKPDNFLDSKEKFLISVATKGVVKLFNAVNKAQHPQKGLNPSRSKDAKVLAKRRKETFLSELHKSTNRATGSITKVPKLSEEENGDEPGWAPLRDSYMLTSSKLKDWDKLPVRDSAATAATEKTPLESSSDEE